jgi:type II secretory pathway pseudopilin PulG
MLIISIVSGIAIMTISFNPQKKIETAANSLANTITLAAEEAMLRPATLGLAFTENSYTFFIYEEPKDENANPWQPISNKVFHRHQFPKEAEISLKVQDQLVELNGKPQIIIAENGDFTPFTVTIQKAGDKPLYQIHGNTNGEVVTELAHEK